MKTRKYEAMAGDSINHACQQSVAIAKRNGCNVEFDFNGIKLTASPDTDPAALARFYGEECDRRHAAYVASPEYKQRQEEAERRERERQTSLDAALADAPATMTLRDADGWQRACDANKDGYGGAVMSYAERWARLMEVRMAKGERLAAIASECSYLADSEGITGFMYGAAVSTLARVWIHGEALRLWHNLKTQIGDEGKRANESGGVLNPAMLSIG